MWHSRLPAKDAKKPINVGEVIHWQNSGWHGRVEIISKTVRTVTIKDLDDMSIRKVSNWHFRFHILQFQRE